MTKDNHLLGKFDLNGIPPAPRGVPQIDVTFDIDANGILKVSAQDKTSGKCENITITNDEGRLSQADIERMVRESEEFKVEDDKQKERIAAKNSLESYCFNMKATVEDTQLNGKISESDRKTISDRCNETLKWLDAKQMAEMDEFTYKQKELEGICQPIIAKLYQNAQSGMPGGGGNCGRQSGQNFGNFHSGPTVEEVD